MRHSSPGLLFAIALLCVAGCGRSLYTLPTAPPESDWATVDERPQEDPQEAAGRTIAAKQNAIEVLAALQGGDWDQAVSLMSQDTRNFFDDGSEGQGAAASLAAGRLVIGGNAVEFSPIDDLFISDLITLKDTFVGAPRESETKNRKELYAISKDGRARKVVMIFEADAWRFHSPALRTSLINPGGKP